MLMQKNNKLNQPVRYEMPEISAVELELLSVIAASGDGVNLGDLSEVEENW